MNRLDVSDYLVHWTSGEDDEEAFLRLLGIVTNLQISGNYENIKGNFLCVCFTEAPSKEFHRIKTRYRPFGVQVSKKWLYSKGGRPVIYQSDSEYQLLPQELKWRHVRYEPNRDPPIDFTWEREWRIAENYLYLEREHMRVLVPNQKWADELICECENYEMGEYFFYATQYGQEYLGMEPEGFNLSYSILNA